MTIAFGSNSAGAAGSIAAVNVNYPSGISAGDLLVIFVVFKYPAAGCATPSGFIAPSNNSASGGAGSSGVDSGQVTVAVFVRVATGSESGSVVVGNGSMNAIVAYMLRYTKTAAAWNYACTNGSDNTAGTSWSATMAADPDIQAGDFCAVYSGVNASTGLSVASESLSCTGVTFGSMTERLDGINGIGDNVSWFIVDFPVSAGPSSAAPVYTATHNTTVGANAPAGASVLLRLREFNPDAAGTSGGVATVSGVAAATMASAGSAAGAGTASGAGAGAFMSAGSSAGVATVAGAGAIAVVIGPKARWTLPDMTLPSPRLLTEAQALYGRDIRFDGDLRVTSSADWATVEDLAVVRQSILNEAMTTPGEFAFRPEYGMGLADAVKRPMTRATIDELRNRISERLLRNPRVTSIKELTVEATTVTGTDGRVKPALKVTLRIEAGGKAIPLDPIIIGAR